MKKYILSVFFNILVMVIYAQNWIVYSIGNSHSPYNSYSSIAIDSANSKWFCKPSGFGAKTIFFDNDTTWESRDNIIGSTTFSCLGIKIDKRNVIWERDSNNKIYSLTGGVTGVWQKHDAAATGVVAMDGIFDMAVDNNNNKWFASNSGLVKYNDTVFTLIDTANSDLPFEPVNKISIDKNNNILITGNSNIAKYDGNSWQVFPLPDSHIDEMVIDSTGALWLGLGGFGNGLYKFDGSAWTNYTTGNSGIPSNLIYAVAIDKNNNFWTSYSGGLTKFDGTTWINYDASAGYPGTGGGVIAVDRYNNIWNCSAVGVIVFNETGVVGINEINQQMRALNLYPNPSNDHVTISVETANSGNIFVTILNSLGQSVNPAKTFKIEEGKNDLQIDVASLRSGIYFVQVRSDKGIITKKFIKQ